jgi:hypothetical protein
VHASSGGPAPYSSRRTLETDGSVTFGYGGGNVHHGLAAPGDVLAVRAALAAADFKRALGESAAQDYPSQCQDCAELTITAAGMDRVTIPVYLLAAELQPALASLDRACRNALGLRYDWPVGQSR